MTHPPFLCPETGEPLDEALGTEDGHRYPRLDEIPVLMRDVGVFLARHAPGWRTDLPWAVAEPDPLPVDAPDPFTPFLSPRQLAKLAETEPVSESFRAFLRQLGDATPVEVCAGWGEELAPEGPALDLGCGLGPMALRMAGQGRPTTALDRSPRAVMMARDLLLGRLPEAYLPEERGGSRVLSRPFSPPDPGLLRFCIADATEPPFDEESFAWVHLGNLVDVLPDGPSVLIEAAARLLQPGGLLTVSTPHDLDLPTLMGRVDPGASLRALCEGEGLFVVDEQDPVPWVVRQYSRGYRLLFSDCLALRRPLHD